MRDGHPEINDKVYGVGTIVRVFVGHVMVQLEGGRLMSIPLHQLVWVPEDSAWYYGTNES